MIGATFNQYTRSSWVVTAYLLTYTGICHPTLFVYPILTQITGFLPIASKLTDIIGRRRVLLCFSWFVKVALTVEAPSPHIYLPCQVWSAACGSARTMNQLIIFRAIQGIGGSSIYSAVLVTISTMVPQVSSTRLNSESAFLQLFHSARFQNTLQ